MKYTLIIRMNDCIVESEYNSMYQILEIIEEFYCEEGFKYAKIIKR